MKSILLFTLLVLMSFIPKEPSKRFLDDYLTNRYPNESFDQFLLVSVKSQKMFIYKGGKVLKSYPVSTALNGVGNINNSNCTPLGLHKISYKIGASFPKNGIIEGNSFTGEIAKIKEETVPNKSDIITSRAIRLAGMEPGINKGGNVDSYNRHIFIHGTDEEGCIGKPASHGCIRMKNDDVIDLYGRVKMGLKVLILNF